MFSEYNCGEPIDCFNLIASLLDSINSSISKQSFHPYSIKYSVSEIALVILVALQCFVLLILTAWFVLGKRIGNQLLRITNVRDDVEETELAEALTQDNDRRNLLDP